MKYKSIIRYVHTIQHLVKLFLTISAKNVYTTFENSWLKLCELIFC